MKQSEKNGKLKLIVVLSVAVLALGIWVLSGCSPSPAANAPDANTPAANTPDAVTGTNPASVPAPAPESKPAASDSHGGCPYAAMQTDLEAGSTAAPPAPPSPAEPSPAEPGAAASSSGLARLVFLTTSKSCPCTMNRCQKGEEAVNAALKNFPDAPALERLDHAENEDQAKEILAKNPATMLPVLYLFDDKGAMLAKLEGEFDEPQVSETLGKYLSKQK